MLDTGGCSALLMGSGFRKAVFLVCWVWGCCLLEPTVVDLRGAILISCFPSLSAFLCCAVDNIESLVSPLGLSCLGSNLAMNASFLIRALSLAKAFLSSQAAAWLSAWLLALSASAWIVLDGPERTCLHFSRVNPCTLISQSFLRDVITSKVEPSSIVAG